MAGFFSALNSGIMSVVYGVEKIFTAPFRLCTRRTTTTTAREFAFAFPRRTCCC